jgi:protein TonB
MHVVAIAALLFMPFGSAPTLDKAVDPPVPPIRLHLAPPAPEPDKGGGGTGAPIPPTKGQIPQFARRVFVPPVQQTENAHPILVIEAAMPVETSQPTLTLVSFGDPLAKPGPPSGGMGLNGIGNHGKGGIGYDDGVGTNSRALAGGALTGPVPVYNPDPEFSEEARKAKLQGMVVLEVMVDTDGRAHRIRVRSGLGLGLDEKAIEAVQTWKFRPGTRNGTPIAAPATIYINFRLL